MPLTGLFVFYNLPMPSNSAKQHKGNIMAIRYSTEQVARLAEVNKVAQNGYALGFMVTEWDHSDPLNPVWWETMYAIKGDTILMHRHKHSNNFNHPLYKWERVTSVPANAEWIGTYEMPTKIKG